MDLRQAFLKAQTAKNTFDGLYSQSDWYVKSHVVLSDEGPSVRVHLTRHPRGLPNRVNEVAIRYVIEKV